MPKLRKRKSDQLPPSCQSGPKTNSETSKIKSQRKSLGENDEGNTEIISRVCRSDKIQTRSFYRHRKATSDTNIEDESTVQEEREPSTEITVLSDEILIQIFSHLNTSTIVKTVSRVCKRWNRLSKDKVLWRNVDITFTSLNHVTAKRIFRRYCEPGRLKSLFMRAEPQFYDNGSIRRRSGHTKCMTPGTLRKLKEVGSGLERFGIEYDGMHWEFDLLSALPSQLTHLSLAYCDMGCAQFRQLLLPGSKSLLEELSVLDLTGVEVFYANILPENKLPPKLHTLILRDSKFSLYNDRIQQLILDHREQLTELDLSIMPLCYDLLWKIAKQLKKLEYFNLCGCVILERGQDTINFPPRDILYGDDWHVMWGETDGVFESLKVVNLRNLTHAGGDLIEESVFMMASYINPRGRQVLDGWDFDDNQNQALLKDIQRKWREWEESPLEQKQSYSERRERDKERLGLHPDWPENLFPRHPDYKKSKK